MIGFVIHESMNHEVLLLQTLSSFETLLYVVPAFKKKNRTGQGVEASACTPLQGSRGSGQGFLSFQGGKQSVSSGVLRSGKPAAHSGVVSRGQQASGCGGRWAFGRWAPIPDSIPFLSPLIFQSPQHEPCYVCFVCYI